MLGERYVVRTGDSLWRIASETLGDGGQWPRIWRYNNRREVIAVTGSGLPNPDLIRLGQTLLIPVLPGAAKSIPRCSMHTRPKASLSSGSRQATTFLPKSSQYLPPLSSYLLMNQLASMNSPISIKYRLEDLPSHEIDVGTAVIIERTNGDIFLMTKKSYPAIYVTQRKQIELQVTDEANQNFGKLIGDKRYIFDPERKIVTFRSMLVSQSNAPDTVATAFGVEMSSESPIPTLRVEIRLPKVLEGSIGVFRYCAANVSISLQITPRPQFPRPGPQPPGFPLPLPLLLPPVDWDGVMGRGLVAAGSAIIVGSIIEDFFTMGIGVADDVPSFAAGGTMIARGMMMIQGASMALPRAVAPANLSLRTTVSTTRAAP
ncbi:LysM domain-containing protein [Sorangium sp. So ce375]|uniref:LysM peptidoglycan-binding domain-containing protein n=1 Tax=Sorangium sp. So ce375 TaxID=3133306 RepID=UPI003F5B7951